MIRPTPQQIKKTRKEAGLTQTQAGKLVNRALSTWQAYEGGTLDCPPEIWEIFVIRLERMK